MQLETPQGLLTLRQCRSTDVEKYRMLRLEALRSHPEVFSSDYAFNEAQPKAYWVERLSNLGSQGMIYFAESAVGLEGMCGVGLGNSPKTAHSGTIWGVYVRPAWRGLRIAERLIEQCAAWATEHGAIVLKLGVVTTNTSAIRCYRRCGFSVYGEEPQAIQVDGRMYAELLMVRYLD
jgi:ribosomal protein S18 acetylase RimI-like enzyme